MGAILKNRKIAISRRWFARFRRNLARRRISSHLSRPTVKIEILKIQDGEGRHLDKSKNRHISTGI